MTRDNTVGSLAEPARLLGLPLATILARLIGRALLLSLALGFLMMTAAIALPAPLQEEGAGPEQAITPGQARSGSFLMRHTKQDPWTVSPAVGTQVRVRVAGVVARATVSQRFRNDSDEWVEGVYVFPLPENAAVDHLLMRVGERTIEGQIRERAQAKAEYQQARDEGRKASLVEQERPNIFTTSVANLGPDEELVVEIEFQQTLAFDAGEVRLRFPLVVAPRYITGQPLVLAGGGLAGTPVLSAASREPISAPERSPVVVAGIVDQSASGLGWAFDTDLVPDASRVTPPLLPPGAPLGNPVAIEVSLDAGFPIRTLVSRYHAIVSKPQGEGRYHVALRDSQVPADRDFELAWTPEPATMPRGVVFREERAGATYALLTLFPPAGKQVDEARLPREVVFVIDTSGSMSGLSIQQARTALQLAIDRLRPEDRFNVIEFNSVTRMLWDETRAAYAENRSAARAWVKRLNADGGTEMAQALEAALVSSHDPLLVRQVVFLTDGSVANEDQLFGIIKQRLGDTRLFTVGIGSAPNSHFMTKAAAFGHGTFTYIGDVGEVEQKMTRLFALLESPVLTGIEIAWPASATVEAWPSRIPDLYLGQPVVVSARIEGPAEQVTLAGKRGGEAWSSVLSLAGSRPGDGAGVLWARRKVEALLDSLHEGADPDEVRAGVVALGLEHHLVTKHTSLVAVDVTPSRPVDAGLQSQAVATNVPHGWTVAGELPQSATPAPLHTLVALIALLGAAALRLADRSWRAGERS